LLVENYYYYRIKSLSLLNDFLCPASNMTCALEVHALQSFRDFYDDETRLLVHKNFDFRQ